jgi:CMP/dCMP kinase
MSGLRPEASPSRPGEGSGERRTLVTDKTEPRELKDIVTIDGPAAAGKSTVARLLAKRLGFLLLDSGALYRGLALHLIRQEVSPDAPDIPGEALNSLDLRIEPGLDAMRLFLAAEDITNSIRRESLGDAASRFSVRPEVRRALLAIQRAAGLQWNLVAEGRDMGTVVFPGAAVKFFLVADLESRAKRRHLELCRRGESFDPARVRSEMHERDLRDEHRELSPLIQAPDAILLDATNLSPEDVAARMLGFVNERLHVSHMAG